MNSQILLEVSNKNPKENAKTYVLNTYSDMVRAVNPDNVENFLTDFSALVRLHVVSTVNVDLSKVEIGPMLWTDD